MGNSVNLVIFSYRERISTLANTISCAIKAVPNGSLIDIIVNGNQQLAEQIYLWASQDNDVNNLLNIWYIPIADKGNAWNQHMHSIWRMDMHSIYIDGYVRVSKKSIDAILCTLANKADALGTSGVPTMGATAKSLSRRMYAEGGFHGNLCAIKSEALEQLRARGVHIPIGMYRVDSIIGAFLSFNLDNIKFEWNPHRYIPLTSTASWECDEKKWYRIQDVVAWIKRKNRQAKGDFENYAIKYHLTKLKCALEELPPDVRSLFLAWRESCPKDLTEFSLLSSRHKKAMENIINYVPPEKKICSPILLNKCQL